MITIDGVPFTPVGDVKYSHDYVAIARDIACGKRVARDTYRALISSDLFFILYFIVKPFSQGAEERCNHPWVVSVCQEIESGPDDYTLDVYAREHFKTSALTIAETIQYAMKYPDRAQGIISYARPAAKKILFSIKEILEQNNILKMAYPDVVWANPEKDAPMWSLDDGLVLRRLSNRKEATMSAHGLTEGMPTGVHFERRVYDDIVTEDIADSVDTMEKVKEKFDSSQNLGTIDGTHRVVGTFYHHNDPLTYIRDKKVCADDGSESKRYLLRLKPGSDDGTRDGKPVLLPQKRWDDLKLTRTFIYQQLCDPSPSGETKLNSLMLMEISPEFIPKNLYKYMIIDPAGDSKDGMGDAWAMIIIGVEPESDEMGMNNQYLLDAVIMPMRTSVAIEEAVRMYMRAGILQRVGIEKVGLSSIEVHFREALTKQGRHVSEESGTLMLLKPRGRNKVNRIDAALSWPLSNRKLRMSTAVPQQYRDRIRMEMDKFPHWHEDGCDAWSYTFDILKEYPIPKQVKMKGDESLQPSRKLMEMGSSWMI